MTRVSGSAYDVSRATGVCAATGAAIRPGEEYVAAVVERAGGEEGLERLDYAASAWTAGARPGRPAFAHWRAVMEAPGEHKKQFLDDAALADLFEQTGEASEEAGAGAGAAFRYLLALMLVRRKFLRHEGSRQGVMLVKWTGRAGARASDSAPAIEVTEPAMDAGAMGRAAEEIGRLFQGRAAGWGVKGAPARWLIAAALAGLGFFPCACSCPKPAGEGGAARPATGPVPAYGEIAAAYNERVRPLDRLWATAVVVMRYRDKDGATRREQGEGHIQVILPDRLALSVGKVGETYFWLGGDAERYWWFDKEAGERMWVGRYDTLGTRTEGESPPIHPLDLIELLAITPLPESGGETAWSDDGRSVVVTVPGRMGKTRLLLDPATRDPGVIELLNPSGDVAVHAELSEYKVVTVIGSGLVPRAPGYIVVTMPGRDAEVTLRMSDQESGPKRPKAAAFEFDQLVRALGPNKIVDVDRGAAGDDGQ